MPASSINLYQMQDSKNNFQALRPAPVCADSNMYRGQCQNIHVSTNCYYGYHEPKTNLNNTSEVVDCEMREIPHGGDKVTSSPHTNTRKRSADDCSYPKIKRLRQEVQIKKGLERETIEKMKSEYSTEELLEHLYWKLHGGNLYQACL